MAIGNGSVIGVTTNVKIVSKLCRPEAAPTSGLVSLSGSVLSWTLLLLLCLLAMTPVGCRSAKAPEENPKEEAKKKEEKQKEDKKDSKKGPDKKESGKQPAQKQDTKKPASGSAPGAPEEKRPTPTQAPAPVPKNLPRLDNLPQLPEGLDQVLENVQQETNRVRKKVIRLKLNRK